MTHATQNPSMKSTKINLTRSELGLYIACNSWIAKTKKIANPDLVKQIR